ncbi:Plasmodium vivax Vir protein, putative [Plasmodium vivax]|nr:Plasmodium vivax Vir protein, putative [Plasmodium vivax]
MEDSASRRQVQIKPEVVTVGTEEFKPDISGFLDQKGTMGTGDIGDSPDRAISNPVGTIMGTSLGFFIPLTMLYKFTPLGSWINTRVLGRDKLMDNMKKNELEYLLNTAQTRDTDSGDTMYRIKYNSVLNE